MEFVGALNFIDVREAIMITMVRRLYSIKVYKLIYISYTMKFSITTAG